MVAKRYLYIIALSIVLIFIFYFTTVETGKLTERMLYSGSSENWEAQYTVNNYSDMKTKEFFSLKYKGSHSDVQTEIYFRFSDSFGYFEGTRTLPSNNTINVKTGSSYTYHGPNVNVLIKWNNTEEKLILKESKI